MPYKDPRKNRECCLRWVANHSDKVKENKRKWAAENQDKVRGSRQKWATEHPDKVRESRQRYQKSLIIKKRCPSCNKHFQFRKDYLSFYPKIYCKSCGTKLKLIKTLSDSNKNIHGCKVEAV